MEDASYREYQRHLEENYKKNALISIAESSIYALGIGMIPLNTVIIYFISSYVKSKTLIGLLPTLHMLCFCLTQIFISPYVSSLKRYKPFFMKLASLQRTVWFIITAALLILIKDYPKWFVAFFYFAYSFWGMMNGLTGNVWFVLTAKIIPGRHLAKFFGLRYSINGVFNVIGASVGGFLLSMVVFPYNYAAVFFIVGLTGIISLYLFNFIREPEHVTNRKRPGFKEFAGELKGILKNDRNFRFYIIATYLIAFGKSGYAFQIVYAKDILSVTPEEVAVTTTLMFLSQTLGYVIWSFLNNRYGFKSSICVSAFLFVPGIVLILFAKNIWMIYLSMFIFGFCQSARNSGENSLVSSFCSEEDRPVYISLRNFILAPAFSFSNMLAGFLLDMTGYSTLFYTNIVLLLAGAFVTTFMVKEKRPLTQA